MNTRYSKLLLAFLLLILIVPPVVADEPPKDGPYVEYYESGKKKSEAHYKDASEMALGLGGFDALRFLKIFGRGVTPARLIIFMN